MSEKLLPCPFCGEESITVFKTRVDYLNAYLWIAECNGCFAKRQGEQKQIAINLWDTRPPQSLTVDEILKKINSLKHRPVRRIVNQGEMITYFKIYDNESWSFLKEGGGDYSTLESGKNYDQLTHFVRGESNDD